VGTTSIEISELLSKRLKKEGIKHEVLNAKQHEREAHIIQQAGQPGAVTIATNMAGRGTDIVLGGNLQAELEQLGDNPDPAQVERVKQDWQQRHDRVVEAGGLHIIGTERHESRRVDNQLRGRSGRQGDPGSSRFYLSLEDNLMRIFASEKVGAMMQRMGMEEDEAIEHPWVSRAIENAQRKVEGHNFDIRKQLLEFDDVANDQRRVIYEMRNDLMESDDLSDTVKEIKSDVIESVISQFIPPGSIDEQWDVAGLEKSMDGEFGIRLPIQEWLDKDDSLDEEGLRNKIHAAVEEHFASKEAITSSEVMRQFEKALFLDQLDKQWKEHLANMDYLRRGINLRGYAQRQPKQEYKRESFEMFTAMLENLKHEIVKLLARVQVRTEDDVEAMDEARRSEQPMQYRHAEASAMAQRRPQAATAGGGANPGAAPVETYVREGRKVGRNEPCPCGSGKKYKQCHGKLS